MGDIEYLATQEFNGNIDRAIFRQSNIQSRSYDYTVPLNKEAYILSISAHSEMAPSNSNQVFGDVLIAVNGTNIGSLPVAASRAVATNNKSNVVTGRKLSGGDVLRLQINANRHSQVNGVLVATRVLLLVEPGESPVLQTTSTGAGTTTPAPTQRIEIDELEKTVIQHTTPPNLLEGVNAPAGFTLSSVPERINIATVGAIIVEYIAINADGVELPRRRRRYIIAADRIPPVIRVNPTTVQLERTVDIPDLLEGVTLGDGEPDTTTLMASGDIDNDVVGDYTITYHAQDLAGNVVTATRTYRVVDTTPPVITVEPERVGVEQGSTITNDDLLEGVTTNEGEVSANIQVDTSYRVGTAVTVTYTATDESGNTSTATRLYIITPSTVPVVTVSDNNITLEASLTNIVDMDELLEGVSVNQRLTIRAFVTNNNVETEIHSLDLDTVKTVVVTYRATNTNGQTGENTRTYNVIDTTPPVITLTPERLSIPLNAQNVNVLDGVSASDNTNRPPVVITATPDRLDISEVGEIRVSYVGVDGAGNRSETATRTYVIIDNVGPTFRFNPQTVELPYGSISPNILMGVSATDPSGISGAIQPSLMNINTNVSGNTSVNYSASDTLGNISMGTRLYRVLDAPPVRFTASRDVLTVRNNRDRLLLRIDKTRWPNGSLDDRIRGIRFTILYRSGDTRGGLSSWFRRGIRLGNNNAHPFPLGNETLFITIEELNTSPRIRAGCLIPFEVRAYDENDRLIADARASSTRFVRINNTNVNAGPLVFRDLSND